MLYSAEWYQLHSNQPNKSGKIANETKTYGVQEGMEWMIKKYLAKKYPGIRNLNWRIGVEPHWRWDKQTSVATFSGAMIVKWKIYMWEWGWLRVRIILTF